MGRTLQAIANTILPLVLVFLAIQVGKRLVEGRTFPERVPVVHEGVLVQITPTEAVQITPKVSAQGSVVPARETTIHVEVNGRVTAMHPHLVPGGLVTEGDELIRVDPREFRIQVAEADAALAQAEATLAQELGRARVAEREWELFATDMPATTDAPLALRQPQLRIAQSNVDAANARRERARLNQRRAAVEAPFDAVVRGNTAQIGQFLSPQTPIATLVATDVFWVQAAVGLDRLDEIALPGFNNALGSHAVVRLRLGERIVTREGRVIRVLSDIDETARMARVLIEVDDPLLRGEHAEALRASGALPLFLGAYVDVEVQGQRTLDAVPIPREALRDGHYVWLLTPESTLDIRRVDIGWRADDAVYVTNGLAGGESLIISHLAVPVHGMLLRTDDAAMGQEATTARVEAEDDDV